jgi:uncharacterized protein (TIGR03000 family)
VIVEPAAPAPSASDEASRNSSSAYFTVAVPVDAKVSINGKDTTSVGASRTYVSRSLNAGRRYKYEITAQVNRNGQTIADTKTVYVRTGERQNLSFALTEQSTDEQIADEAEETEPQKTTLKLQVPDQADVSLSGSKTNSTGPVRVFTTTQLKAGETWDNYVVRVEVNRDGERLSKDVTISLTAGETRELSIVFDDGKLAGIGK